MTVIGMIEGARHLHSGKVRELYVLANGNLLVVATDRISAYDFVLSTTIPDKGAVLTRMSLWWFDQLRRLMPNHILSTDVPPHLRGRAVICERLEMLPVECVARGYLAGSGYAEYRRTGSVCGIEIPPGLQDGSRLPEPIFTPTTKAAIGGHDENVSFEAVIDTVGAQTAAELRDSTLAVYQLAEAIARQHGILVADTKLEFGLRADGRLTLADEVLTPDSSRFWLAESWQPGRTQFSYDKQIVRNWLISPESGWSPESGEPPPPLPSSVVEQTRAAYIEAFERLTGETF